jgi:hypothetical protein
MAAPPTLSHLVAEYQNVGFDDDAPVVYDRQTGEIHFLFDDLEGMIGEEGAELLRLYEQDKSGRFVQLPSQFDRDDYRIMQKFAYAQDGEAGQRLQRAIHGRGAFRYFKDTVYELDLENDWYQFRDQYHKRDMVYWCRENDIDFIDDMPGETPDFDLKEADDQNA